MHSFSFLIPRNPIKKFFSLLAKLPFSDRLLLHTIFALVVASGLSVILSVNAYSTETVPVIGGTITEGIIGSPRLANPILATTRADKDVSSLIYAGVMRYDDGGKLIPHLAEEVTLSEDRTTYTIKLRKDIRFHDGSQLTAEDVIFTYESIKKSETKSPLRGAWDTVNIEQINTHALTIKLPEPYIPFIENLTVGILPTHIWKSVPPQEMTYSVHNTEPIGAGPFMIDTISRSNHGSVKSYKLVANPYYIKEPYLDKIELRFFATNENLQKALENKEITSTADLSYQSLNQYEKKGFTIHRAPLPQVFAIFFNQNRSDVLREKVVRQALNMSVDRNQIINEALFGYAIPTTNTSPTNIKTLQAKSATSSNIENARKLLRNNGWKRNDSGIWQLSTDDNTLTLSVTIQTINDPVLAEATEIVAKQWRELGAEVKVEQYEQSNLVNSIIRPRSFEAVMFGIEIGRQVDLYPFWHSSQQTDPGLNIAQYANLKVDERLEILRKETDPDIRKEIRNEIYKTLEEEIPAVFLYTPTINYLTDNKLKIDNTNFPEGPHNRFSFIARWHTSTDKLWPIFHKNYAIRELTKNYNLE